jgi:hypothetical protein
LTKEEQAEKDILDSLASASGFKEAMFLPEVPAGRFFPGGK